MCRNRWRTFTSTLTLTAMEERFRGVRTADGHGRTLQRRTNRWRPWKNASEAYEPLKNFHVNPYIDGYRRTLQRCTNRWRTFTSTLTLTAMEERFRGVRTAEELSRQPLHWRLWKNASEVYETLTAMEERFRGVRTAEELSRQPTSAGAGHS